MIWVFMADKGMVKQLEELLEPIKKSLGGN